MADRKTTLTGNNIFLIVTVALWIGVLIYGTVAVSSTYIDREITIMSVVSTALLLLAGLPIALAIHYTNKDTQFRGFTRGLLVMTILFVVSDIVLYLAPDSLNSDDMMEIGQLLYAIACLAILVPTGLTWVRCRKENDRMLAAAMAEATIIVLIFVGYAIFSNDSAMQTNGSLIAWSAAFVVIESVVVIVLVRAAFLDLPENIRNLMLLASVYFAIELIGDAINFVSLLHLQAPVDLGYNTRPAATCFSVADVFLTAALWLYSWKTLNPFTIKKVSDKLSDTSRMMDELIGQSPDAICVYSPDGNAVTANEAFYRAWGVRPDDVAGKLNVFEDIPRAGVSAEEVAKLRHGGTVIVKDLYFRPTDRHFTIKIYPTYSASNAISGYITNIEDITEQVGSEERIRASLEEKNVLLKEIHHRVKNNLQIVSSLLNLQSSYITDPVALGYFKESQDRVKSMALVHERLYQSENLSKVDFSDYITGLTVYLFHTYNVGAGNIRMNTEMEPMTINIDKAVSCGLILNELMTNSLKYAFPGGRKGEITVRMSMAGDRYVMEVGDDGIGLPAGLDFRESSTLGMQLVVMLTSQLEGSIELDRSAGTKFTITFPA